MNYKIKDAQVLMEGVPGRTLTVDATGEDDIVRLQQKNAEDNDPDHEDVILIDRKQFLDLTKLAIRHGVFTLSDLL